MAYKSILSVLTDPALVDISLAAATSIAAQEDAHVDVLSLGIDRTQVGYAYLGSAPALIEVSIERAEADAAQVDKAARAYLDRQDIRWGTEAAVAQLGGLGPLVEMKARFADLVVLARPYGKGRGPEGEAVLEAALFEGQAPVLVVPDAGITGPIGKRIVIAWNEGREAMAAVRRALPWLKQADVVNITVIDPPPSSPERSDPGGMLCQMLVRHGVKAEVSVLAKTAPRVSDVLVQQARDVNADLVVMGAYGHSRLREAILGGATRDMLENAALPVFLAH